MSPTLMQPILQCDLHIRANHFQHTHTKSPCFMCFSSINEINQITSESENEKKQQKKGL